MSTARHFINILDHDAAFLAALIDAAIRDKKRLREGTLLQPLVRKTVVIYFEKQSLRTKVSFEVAVVQLGGSAIYLTAAGAALGTREPVKDAARVLSRMCDGIVARVFSHDAVEELAEFSTVPVINALTDRSHPCQAMADLLTAQEKFGRLEGLKLVFVGDGNNVARSLAAGCGRLGVTFVLAAPPGYQLAESEVEQLGRAEPGLILEQTDDPRRAVREADIVYTDTWISMGQEEQRRERLSDFDGFQVNAELLALAKATAVVMHCLPAYRGCEVTDEVMESDQSLVFEQAENRLHFQRTLLATLIGEGE